MLLEFELPVDPILESDLDDPLRAYSAVWVAADGAVIVGSVAVRLMDDTRVAELKRMYLHIDYRGQGIGRALLDHAIGWAIARSCDSIVLDTTARMTDAQRLYESAGFTLTGSRVEEGATGSRCELLYSLALNNGG